VVGLFYFYIFVGEYLMNTPFKTSVVNEEIDWIKHLLTVEELADQLKVKKSWVYAQTRQIGPGTIPRVKCGKYLRFYFEDVFEWLKMKTQESE